MDYHDRLAKIADIAARFNMTINTITMHGEGPASVLLSGFAPLDDWSVDDKRIDGRMCRFHTTKFEGIEFMCITYPE